LSASLLLQPPLPPPPPLLSYCPPAPFAGSGAAGSASVPLPVANASSLELDSVADGAAECIELVEVAT